MISIVARAAGVEEELPLLLVGIAEAEDGGGRAFHFQCDLRRNEYEEGSNWPEGESYCVSNEGGFTRFGCVSEIESKGNAIRVVFTGGLFVTFAWETLNMSFRLRAKKSIWRRFCVNSAGF